MWSKSFHFVFFGVSWVKFNVNSNEMVNIWKQFGKFFSLWHVSLMNWHHQKKNLYFTRTISTLRLNVIHIKRLNACFCFFCFLFKAIQQRQAFREIRKPFSRFELKTPIKSVHFILNFHVVSIQEVDRFAYSLLILTTTTRWSFEQE